MDYITLFNAGMMYATCIGRNKGIKLWMDIVAFIFCNMFMVFSDL